MVLDTPGGLHGKRLDEVLKIATRVIVPLQPSIFDIFATRACSGPFTAVGKVKPCFGSSCVELLSADAHHQSGATDWRHPRVHSWANQVRCNLW